MAASCSRHEVIRDCNGPRALETLLRYRGSVFAELFRSLEVLKKLQAEARAPQPMAALPAGLTAPASSTK